MELSVIIVNWNSKAYVRDCVASLAAYCDRDGTEVVVVDGGSFDGCDRMLAAEFPWVRFVQSPDNVGFARGNNLGVRHARGRHLLFLNPDTLLLEDSLRILGRRLDNLPQAGAAGCRLLNADRTLQASCVQSFPTVVNQVFDAQWLRDRFPRARLWGATARVGGTATPYEVEALSGACLAVTRSAFEQVGGFTESYFMYGEDIDLCYKLRAAGWKVFHLPETCLVHFGGGSSQKAPGESSVVTMRASVQHFLRLRRGPGAAATYRLAMGAAAVGRLSLLCLGRLLGSPPAAAGNASRKKWSAVLRWSLGLAVAPVRHCSNPGRFVATSSSGRN